MDADVVIAGGGMAGMTLALALAQGGLNVIVCDAAKPESQLTETYDGRASAIAFACFRMWGALGLAPLLEAHAQRIEEILVTDGRAGKGPSLLSLHFDRKELDPAKDGEPLGFMLENRRIRATLAEAAPKQVGQLRLFAPVAVTGYTPHAGYAEANLADGRVLNASLVIGAEGRKSAIRDAARIRTIGWAYGQTAIVCTARHELPHHGVAHEFFLPPGPFAILPLTHNRANVVWIEKTKTAQAIRDLGEADFLAELKLRFGDFLGTVELIGPRFGYPLSLQLAENSIAPRMALIGDASHAVHPIAGQGLNMGLRDVAALAECVLDSVRVGLDPGDYQGLSRYQKWRRFDNMALAVATDGFNRLFSNDFPPLRAIRERGVALVDALPFARRFFMREAGGGVGDLPKLLRGEGVTL
jgi:2-octaprenyl-6-methoxyphenol hydroxylase